MSSGLKDTFRYLARTENEAAVGVLIAALDSPVQGVRDYALRALMSRRSPRGHEEVFRRLPALDDHGRAIVRERPDRLVRVVSDALASADPAVFDSACEMVLAFRLYDSLPGLVNVLGQTTPRNRSIAAETVLKLTDLFYQELSAPDEQSKDKDLDSLRRRITSVLEDGLRRFNQHRSTQVVEAFLLVAKQQNVTLRSMLQQPGDTVRLALSEVLTNSARGGVMRLLLSFLEDPQMPQAVREVLASRCDPKFVEHLLQIFDTRVAKAVGESVARIHGFAWAKAKHPLWSKFNPASQGIAVQLLMASAMDRGALLKLLGYLLSEGTREGQRAAAEALASFESPEATVLVVKALGNEDPVVRAHLLRQLRRRNVPGAMSILIRMVDSPHEEVRNALRQALPEFMFLQFLASFDSMPEELRPTAGHLVRKIDTEAESLLAVEMKSLSRVRRRRAALATRAMGLVRELEKELIELLSDEDHMVRIAVADALAECDTMPSWEALREALLDRSVVVQETAEQSLLRISQSLTTRPRSDLEEVNS
jgi:HEAT repeat protein